MGDLFRPLLLLETSLWEGCTDSLHFHFAAYKMIIRLVHVFHIDIVAFPPESYFQSDKRALSKG